MTFAELQSEYGKKNVYREDDNIVIGLSHDVMFSYDDVEQMDEELQPYTVDVDYEWMIGMGDDMPNALIIKTESMLDNKDVLSFIDGLVG